MIGSGSRRRRSRTSNVCVFFAILLRLCDLTLSFASVALLMWTIYVLFFWLNLLQKKEKLLPPVYDVDLMNDDQEGDILDVPLPTIRYHKFIRSCPDLSLRHSRIFDNAIIGRFSLSQTLKEDSFFSGVLH